MRSGGTLAALCALVACSENPSSDETERDPLPPATGVIGAFDWEALQEGNVGARCTSDALESRVDALLASMTVDQKLFEMHGTQAAVVDGFYLAGGNEELGIPSFRMADGPRGVRTQDITGGTSGTATAFPVAMARGATWDPELERRVGEAIGKELAAKGGNVLLAPTVNLLRHPGWGRAQETYSEDPVHMGDLAVAFIAGAQQRVLASVKHFAVNSVENTRFTMSANLDERTLREVYLPHFRRAVVEAHVASVMTAYNRVNGVYAAENTLLVSDILRDDWGFSGFVESDWYAGTRSTVPSLNAGLDIEMPAANYYGEPLRAALDGGEVDESLVDRAVRRILRQKLCFEAAPAPPDPSVVESLEHAALALEVAEKSIVLLKNDERTLPLTSPGKLVLVGSLIDEANLGDRGSSSVVPARSVSPLEGLRAAVPDAEIAAIPTDEPSPADLARVAESDVAIVVAGLTYREEGEFIPIAQEAEGLARGGDREVLTLPAAQVRLIEQVAASAKRTVVVLEGGSAIEVRDWIDDVDALVMAWYPGMEGGTAIANVLLGNVNPSGKLPVTFPRRMADLPPWDIVSLEIEYDAFHGYRLLDREEIPPEFPFGFGLSYTEFRVGRLELTPEVAPPDGTVRVRVDVGNAGDTTGAEVVQVYVGANGSSVDRPLRTLQAFRRVELDPGEVKTVELDVPVANLAYFDVASGDWIVESLEYTVSVGTSSRDLPLTASFRVR